MILSLDYFQNPAFGAISVSPLEPCGALDGNCSPFHSVIWQAVVVARHDNLPNYYIPLPLTVLSPSVKHQDAVSASLRRNPLSTASHPQRNMLFSFDLNQNDF